jgi:two-component system CheB/CheR fusion protein
VILSGTASDGALGIRHIKAAGGITLAQKPDTAKYDGMPRVAIATGMVDLVLSPERIGAKLAAVARHPYLLEVQPTGALDDGEMQRLFDLLRPISGVDFKHYKLPTIKRRLLRRMALHRLTELSDYIRMLQSTPGEVRSLYQDLLIHVTRFFREPESFDALSREVFPQQPGPTDPRLGIGVRDRRGGLLAGDVPGRGDSEEPRRRAHPALRDRRERERDRARARRRLRQDHRSRRLARASPALLHQDRRELPDQQASPRPVRVRPPGPHRDPPFSRLDLIMCRNVLIYMDTVLQKKLVHVFHYALNPTGYLVLGQAETVGPHAGLFKLVDKKFRVHRKRVSPVYPAVAFPVDYTMPGLPRRKAAAEPATTDNALQGEVSRASLERYAPSGVVVDADMQTVQFRGQTGAFLEPAPGEASLNLLKMAREGLLYGLRTAVHSARKSRQPVRREGLQVRSGTSWRDVTLEVIPLAAGGRPHFLVLFEPADRAKPVSPPPKAKGSKTRRSSRERASQVDLLQRELAASREYLQSIIQELEAANEELQSANEEILSSNEELQSTNEELDTAKEELQSTNEELNTVNEELHGRNDELSRVNSDLVNLVGSVQIAIVMVSTDLRIRRFTPMAERILNLIPADLDRSIGHINPNIDGPTTS